MPAMSSYPATTPEQVNHPHICLEWILAAGMSHIVPLPTHHMPRGRAARAAAQVMDQQQAQASKLDTRSREIYD